jgi:hypothetical protein
MDGKAYLDGPFNSVDWTNAAALNGAIANVGLAKVGVAPATLASGHEGEVTPGRSGWAIYGLPTGQPEDHCASLCGYGLLPELVGLFERHRVNVNYLSGVPAGLCYAMFTWGRRWDLVVADDAGGPDVFVEEGFELVVRRHLVLLAALFAEADPPAPAVGEVVLDPHRYEAQHSIGTVKRRLMVQPVPIRLAQTHTICSGGDPKNQGFKEL